MEHDNHWAIGSLRRDVFDLIDGFIAIYLRISDDDNDIGEKKKESSSISNQLLLYLSAGDTFLLMCIV